MMSKKFLIVALAALLGVGAPVFSGCDRLKRNSAKLKRELREGLKDQKAPTADSETPEEQCQRGDLYLKQKNYTEAVKYYRKAAERGHAPAQGFLGFCYEMGYGVPKDMKEALYWYRKAADQGDAKAQCSLGLYYMDSNRAEARMWFRKAADQGNDSAKSMLEQLDKLDRMRF